VPLTRTFEGHLAIYQTVSEGEFSEVGMQDAA
jgi:hypothetical protein